MLLNLHSRDKRNWASEICYILYKYDFGIVWESQGVGDIRLFVLEFKRRLLESFKDNWSEKINSSEHYKFYSSIKHSLVLSPYLLNIKHVQARSSLARFRLGMSPLRFRSLRFFNVPNSPLQCPFCEDSLENEVHFMLVCPLYSSLRLEYIPVKFSRRPSLSALSRLLATINPTLSMNVALFVYYALQIRMHYIDNNK